MPNQETLCPTCRGTGETVRGEPCHDCDESGIVGASHYRAEINEYREAELGAL